MNNINFLDYFELENWFLPSSSTVSRAPSSWSRKSLASEMGNANVLTISTPKIKKQRCKVVVFILKLELCAYYNNKM